MFISFSFLRGKEKEKEPKKENTRDQVKRVSRGKCPRTPFKLQSSAL